MLICCRAGAIAITVAAAGLIAAPACLAASKRIADSVAEPKPVSKPARKPATGKSSRKAAVKLGRQIAHLVPNNQDFEVYLDRLMMAESSGRDFLKNPRSTALGPFQFIKGTFLYVVRRHFKAEIEGKSEAQILAMRTNRSFARRVIAQYTHELARHLARNNIPTTYGNLRLAYLLGPSGSTRVLTANPATPIRFLISKAAVTANPFLRAMTAKDLIARAERDISMDRSKQLAVDRSKLPKGAAGPRIKVRCNLSRPSCRRWLALKKRRLNVKTRRASKR